MINPMANPTPRVLAISLNEIEEMVVVFEGLVVLPGLVVLSRIKADVEFVVFGVITTQMKMPKVIAKLIQKAIVQPKSLHVVVFLVFSVNVCGSKA